MRIDEFEIFECKGCRVINYCVGDVLPGIGNKPMEAKF
jgi:hypothetical protein